MNRNREKLIRAAAVCCTIGLALIMAGCGMPENQNLPEASTPKSPNTTPTFMTPTLPTPVDATLRGLIDKATSDLARRLAVPENQIVLLEASAVVWPDASLGCPEEGMQYAQVLTPGYLIQLGSGDQEYEYHASRGTTVMFCVNPAAPVSGTPSDI